MNLSIPVQSRLHRPLNPSKSTTGTQKGPSNLWIRSEARRGTCSRWGMRRRRRRRAGGRPSCRAPPPPSPPRAPARHEEHTNQIRKEKPHPLLYDRRGISEARALTASVERAASGSRAATTSLLGTPLRPSPPPPPSTTICGGGAEEDASSLRMWARGSQAAQ
jgi:hypothetical protein